MHVSSVRPPTVVRSEVRSDIEERGKNQSNSWYRIVPTQPNLTSHHITVLVPSNLVLVMALVWYHSTAQVPIKYMYQVK